MPASIKARTFLKWAGGKSQLLGIFERYFPNRFETYFEPFLGGGAVFFHLAARSGLQKAIISDSNPDLMNCYVVIRDRIDELLARLRRLQENTANSVFFYRARRRFNDLKLENGMERCIEKAALLIYLNKTCYNGLYRVNSKAKFNVPWGRYKSPRIFNEPNLRAVNSILNKPGVHVMCEDFTKSTAKARKGDFVYFDPPYQPISPTASFTAYTRTAFGPSNQTRLAKVFHELDSRRCLLMLSNSPAAESLYTGRGYRIERVKAARAINSLGSARGPVDEILVMNY